MTKRVHVAVAVIRDQQNRVLIARRPEGVHQGGKLEFPGGKVEAGETVQQALQRELQEELGIQVSSVEPLIKISHDYGDKAVCLDVWQVRDYAGQAYGREEQPIFWLCGDELQPQDFPAANVPIINAINLPRQLMLTPDLSLSVIECVAEISSRIDSHQPNLVVLRLPKLAATDYQVVAENLLAKYPHIQWQVHSDAALAKRLACGLHLPASYLASADKGALDGLSSLSASIHSQSELALAEALGVDYALLGAVKATATHPNADRLEWAGFQSIVEQAHIPVYALGGMQFEDEAVAIQHGAQGVAGIGLFTAVN